MTKRQTLIIAGLALAVATFYLIGKAGRTNAEATTARSPSASAPRLNCLPVPSAVLDALNQGMTGNVQITQAMAHRASAAHPDFYFVAGELDGKPELDGSGNHASFYIKSLSSPGPIMALPGLALAWNAYGSAAQPGSRADTWRQSVNAEPERAYAEQCLEQLQAADPAAQAYAQAQDPAESGGVEPHKPEHLESCLTVSPSTLQAINAILRAPARIETATAVQASDFDGVIVTGELEGAATLHGKGDHASFFVGASAPNAPITLSGLAGHWHDLSTMDRELDAFGPGLVIDVRTTLGDSPDRAHAEECLERIQHD